MTRILLLTFALALLVPSDVLSVKTGAVWKQRRVSVYDHTPEVWRPVVEEAVVRYNTLLPKRAPHLLYTPMDERDCPAVDALAPWHRRGITVCLTDSSIETGARQFNGLTVFRYQKKTKGTRLRAVTIQIDYPGRGATGLPIVCHELMHATTGAHHFAWAMGVPEFDCPYDPDYARKVYRRYVTEKKQRKHTRHHR